MSWATKVIKVLNEYETRRRARRPVDVAWKSALTGEVRFWEKNLRTYKQLSGRLDPTMPLQPEIAELLPSGPGPALRVLDVGAGLVTWLGKTIPDRELTVEAVDALGDEYAGIFERVGLTPPVPTLQCDTERLSDRFGENEFDLAYARNTLDHSYDPVTAIREMIRVAKPGAPVLLEHAENEAEEERYLGLHQWNFLVEDDNFFVWRPGTRHDMRAVLADIADVEVARKGEPLDRVVLRKH